jgi:hypothetical protein
MAINNTERNNEIAFLPFYAINKYIRDEYRLSVIRSTIQAIPDLPAGLRSTIERIIRQSVNVPGFRNGAKAPSGLLIKPLVSAFEKKSVVVAAILAAWVEIHTGLRDQVFSLLKARNWDMHPVDADRMNLPGFIPNLPAGENFESLTQAFIEMFPDEKVESDDVLLMSVWLSGRLPYKTADETITEG